MSKRKSTDDADVSFSKKRKSSRRIVSDEEEENGDDSISDNSEINNSQNPDFQPQTELKEGEVGIIEKVSVKNFMCHSRLDVSLGPHVNFVVGRNGSGKSAVVTAVVVGLGGKASVTSRGSSVKSFIKTGKRKAEIEVKLRNRGLDAYKPDLYGDSILVQRKLFAEGGSRYELRSKEGKLVSDKREELAHILDQFNIQVDNPVAILNQDTSRNFLNSKSPQDKYKFFLKATQLDQMKKDYATANQQKTITNEIIERKTKTLPYLEKEVLKWEQKFKAFHALDKLKDKEKQLKKELAWSIVSEKERAHQSIEKEIKDEEGKLPKIQQKTANSKVKIKQLTARQKEINDKVMAISDEVKKLEPDLHTKKKNVHDSKEQVRQAQNVFRKYEDGLKSVKRDRELVIKKIDEIKSSSQTNYEADRLARQATIEELQESLEHLQAKNKSTSHDREQYLTATSRLKNEVYTLGQDEQQLRGSLNQSKRQLDELMASRKDRFQRFGRYIPAVMNRIDEYHKSGKFHQKPRGPLGACFQLKEQKWALATESCLKGLVSSFCCHDHHDEKLLEQIFAKECPNKRPSIITCQFRSHVHDVSKHRVQCKDYPSLLDIIKTDDPVIANTLIDQRGVENVILISDNKEARHVMEHKAPYNCKEAFTLVGDQIYCAPTFRYYSNNNDKALVLTSNVEEGIQACKMEVQKLETNFNQLRQKRQQFDAEIRTNQKEEKQCETQLMKIMEAINSTNHKIKELMNIEDPAPVDVSTLEEEIEGYNQQIVTLEENHKQAVEDFKEKQACYQQAETEYRDTQKKIKTRMEESEPLQIESNSVSGEITSAKHSSKRNEEILKNQEKTIADFQKKKEKCEEELEELVRKATKFCPERVNTNRGFQTLQSEIMQINKTIKNEEKLRGNYEEITKKYKETGDAFRKIKHEVTQLRKFNENMEKIMANRNKQYSKLRQYIALRAKYFFIILLSNRTYQGKMSFNHKEESLEITVMPAIQGGESAKDLKSLSGGERSFSTVCFILALWDAMESPFRCLDEFDVFMDMVNRRISMDMMMVVAKEQTGRQFIFLTPQDMSQLDITQNFRIFRMPNPDRGQQTLNFSQAGDANEDEENA
ncbi:hypothetical protein SNE40_004723 [Patella caerulea]|uniref:Rad50/SbcC-type AAA domain-containing protein n=1 Tax=Patella caerulea TaxID=87958 RepID=A0AAN8PYG6_PATCE